jgi:hypothetical protein
MVYLFSSGPCNFYIIQGLNHGVDVVKLIKAASPFAFAGEVVTQSERPTISAKVMVMKIDALRTNLAADAAPLRPHAASNRAQIHPIRSRRGLITLLRCISVVSCIWLLAGCSKNSEPRITGRRSDPPVSLRCAWQPGYRYHLHLELSVITDPGTPEMGEGNLHRVTFAEECLVTATNKGTDVGLDMEILSIAMERAKGNQIPLSFDSEQGGEAADELGYVPVLTNLIGGHLRFLVSAEGKMLRANGINEWIARALGEATGRVAAGPAPANIPVVSKMPQGSARRNTVANTLRNFFTQDLFRQVIEFGFVPAAPVRIGEEWKAHGDVFVSGHGRYTFDGTGKFEGWQQHGQTNCARVALSGAHVAPAKAPPPPGTNQKKQNPDSLHGTLWIDPSLSFPATSILEAHIILADQNVTRKQGTNNVTIKVPPKTVRQNLAIRLLEANAIPQTPTPEAGDAKPNETKL